MCVDITDLNIACPNDPYSLPDIDRLINGSSCYRTLSLMDAYPGYNKIWMDPLYAPKMAFMSNRGNYYYNVMSFDLKSSGLTYRRLMDVMFAYQIGRNLEVYVHGMIVKTIEGCSHAKILEDVMQSIRIYDMRMNPSNCSFGV